MLRKTLALLLSMIFPFTLCACSLSNQPEHLAFAVSLCLDRSENGALTMGVQIPSLGGSKSSEGGGDESAGYAIYTASAQTFPEALELLQDTIPSRLMLSELKTIIVSEKLARDPSFPKITEEMLLTYHLYGVSRVVVTLGEAEAFLKAQKPVVGTRLSASVNAALEHYHEAGTIPLTSLFGLYADSKSVYSDPLLILAATADEKETGIPPGAMGAALPGALPRTGENKNEYLGSALMRDGVMVGVLNGRQTQWAMLLRGEISKINMLCEGKSVTLSLRGAPKIKLDLDNQPIGVSVILNFTVTPLTISPDFNALLSQTTAQLSETLKVCQNHAVEPFGFADIAGASFQNVPEFEKFGFSDRFAEAEIELALSLHQVSSQ